MSVVYIILASIAVLLLIWLLADWLASRRMRKKLNYMLDALEDKELNFRFDEQRLSGRKFNRSLNRLRNIFDQERHEIMEQEQYYAMMLDRVNTGIAVIDESGRVSYCNKTALALLGMATFGHLRQLRNMGEPLYEAFCQLSEQNEVRVSYYNESEKITLSLKASKTTIGGKEIRIIAFNNISSEIAENEQQSWTKLIRVLTHEIMNTITPIASLSETLLKFDGMADEVKNGLDTISQSSRGLIKFVDSYRNLTRVAKPVKKVFFVREMMERVIQLTREELSAAACSCVYEEKSEDVMLYADDGQISQILVNLIKNAVQAGATRVQISAKIDTNDSVIMDVFNNGRPISKESQDEIFVPFYTTKPEGTGIGLSLSRQIMRLHDGNLRLLRSDEKGTVFQLIFK